MLSDRDIEKLIQPIVDRQNAISRYVIRKIAQRVKEVGELLPSDVYKLERLYKSGADVRAINKEIARLTKIQENEIKKLIRRVAIDSYKDAKPFYDYRKIPFIDFADNKSLQNIVKAIEKQTLGTYQNLSKAQAFMLRDRKNPKILKPTPIAKAYQSVIDEAVQASQSGAVDFRTAMRRTMTQLSDSGICHVEYNTESGRRYSQRLDTAVRRNIEDGVRAINQGVQDETGKQFGADGKEITVHAMSAPDHEPVQGHQFTNEEYEKLQSSEPFKDLDGQEFAPIERHIGVLNCKHFTYSIICGVSKPVYTKAQLEKIKEDNQKGYTDKAGHHYTKYECSQKMRDMETKIRQQKERYMTLMSCGDAEGADKARAKVKQFNKEYSEFARACGLSTQFDRTRVEGYS